MFYIVESQAQLHRLDLLMDDDVYVDIIKSNDRFHCKLASPVAVYIRPKSTTQGFIVPLTHSDGLSVEKERIYETLSKAKSLFTLNKKNLLYYFNLQHAKDLNLIHSMTKFTKLEYLTSNTTIDWYYREHSSNHEINVIIPITKLYERCEEVYDKVKHVIGQQLPEGFDFYNNTATNVFYLLEQGGVGVHQEQFVEIFQPKDPIYNTTQHTVYTEYNLYNSTSRPTNTYNSVNFAAIPKTEQHRKCFKPQNDYFVELDFDGYHLRLLAEQLNYPLTSESAHIQLARQYFGKSEITDEEYTKAKQINFHAIYGKIPNEHKNLPIFKQVQEYIDNMWESFTQNGVVFNPQSGKPLTDKLQDMNPAKLMNYMMQSLETSNNITILKNVLRYLQDKKSFITLYTYDAILFDFSKQDGKQTLEDIKNIMETGGKYPVKFKYNTNLLL